MPKGSAAHRLSESSKPRYSFMLVSCAQRELLALPTFHTLCAEIGEAEATSSGWTKVLFETALT